MYKFRFIKHQILLCAMAGAIAMVLSSPASAHAADQSTMSVQEYGENTYEEKLSEQASSTFSIEKEDQPTDTDSALEITDSEAAEDEATIIETDGDENGNSGSDNSVAMPSAASYARSFLKRNKYVLTILACCIVYLAVSKAVKKKKKEETSLANRPDRMDLGNGAQPSSGKQGIGDEDDDLRGFG